MRLSDLPLRPELVGQRPYGAPQLDVPVRLNVNENPYPPGEALVEALSAALAASLADLNRYPDREALGLRSALAGYLGHGLAAESVWAANGSNEVMTHLLGAFGGPGRRVLTFTPTYSMYPEYARNTHTEFVTAPRRPDHTITASEALAAIERTKPHVVVIASPNNPTGTATHPEVVAEVCRGTEAIVVVDEAYQEFSDQPSCLPLLGGHPRLVVCRTMSKAFSMAGGRVGYLAADEAIVDACRIVRLPYHLSAQTQALATAALAHAPELLARVGELRETSRELQAWLAAQGYEVTPSSANFCLFGRFADREAVWRGLLEAGVLVRVVGPEGLLRVTAGSDAEMAAFKNALVGLDPERML